MTGQDAAPEGSRFRPGGRLEWYGTVLASGLVPLFYHGDPEVAGAVARALVDGGAAGGGVHQSRPRRPAGVSGVGRTTDPVGRGQSRCRLGDRCADGGAVHRRGRPFRGESELQHGGGAAVQSPQDPLPAGCATPTEISTAEEWGAEIVKVFPGKMGGPAFIKDLLGPMPWARLMPTGGGAAERREPGRVVRRGRQLRGNGQRPGARGPGRCGRLRGDHRQRANRPGSDRGRPHVAPEKRRLRRRFSPSLAFR